MGIEMDLAIGYADGHSRKGFELLNSQVALASPGTDHGKEIKDLWAIDGVFCNRGKLERPPTLAQRFFFSPESGINQSQEAKSRAVVRPCADRFLLLCTRSGKGGARRGGVSFDASKQTFRVSSAKVHRVSSYSKRCRLILSKWRKSTISRSEVVLIQSDIKAPAHQISRRCWSSLRIFSITACSGRVSARSSKSIRARSTRA